MALTVSTLRTIKALIDGISHRPILMAACGYPDMLVSAETVAEVFGQSVADAVTFREDSAAILNWHRLDGKLDGVVETRAFFGTLGVEMSVIDLHAHRGGEIIQDMNEPLIPGLSDRFDIVFDGGTMEHCFNIGQAARNVLAMTKVGGVVYHVNPFNISNHGFYNLNPTFYQGFYEQNGHAIVGGVRAIAGGAFTPEIYDGLPKTKRFKSTMPECVLSVVARKLHSRDPAWPVQSKYKIASTVSA